MSQFPRKQQGLDIATCIALDNRVIQINTFFCFSTKYELWVLITSVLLGATKYPQHVLG